MRSSTENRDGWADAARDTAHLVGFRARTVRRPGAAAFGATVGLGLTLVFALAPAAFDADALGQPALTRAVDALRDNLGGAFVGVLLLAVSSSMSSGGGRELLSRSEAAIHPVSPVTEHLGALLLAPLNLAWLVQMWALLAVTALVTPADRLPGAQVVVLAWVLAATALGQAIGWAAEGVRRTSHGVVTVRVVSGVLVVALAGLHLAGALGPVVRSLPTTWVAETAQTSSWPLVVAVLLGLFAVAVALGARPAAWASGCRRARSCGSSPECTRRGTHQSRAGDRPSGRCCAASTGARCGARSACAGGSSCWASAPAWSPWWRACSGAR